MNFTAKKDLGPFWSILKEARELFKNRVQNDTGLATREGAANAFLSTMVWFLGEGAYQRPRHVPIDVTRSAIHQLKKSPLLLGRLARRGPAQRAFPVLIWRCRVHCA